ncbi:MAG: hypothetical protein HYX89_02745 [Chloroflexi bacterium]|nr:hypothetical protein [Chloroflexota bacterium]
MMNDRERQEHFVEEHFLEHRVSDSEEGIGLRRYSLHQTYFLIRLMRLLKRQREAIRALDPTDWRMKLLNKAIYSTYCDCRELGVAEEAQTLLRQAQESVTK